MGDAAPAPTPFEIALSEPLASAWRWWLAVAAERGHADTADAFRLAVFCALASKNTRLVRRQGAPDEEGDRADSPRARAVRFTPNQLETVERAVSKLRAELGDLGVSEGRALELICADWAS